MSADLIPIPISAACEIAERYGYDQIVVIGRKVGREPDPCGEHVTTYGVDATHRHVAARAGRALQRFMGWPLDPADDPAVKALDAAVHALRSYQYGNASPDLAKEVADAGDRALALVVLAPPSQGESAHG